MSIEITGLDNIQKSLNTLSQSLGKREMKSTMHTIGNMLTNTIEESFENERSPWGEKWKPLKIVSFHLGYSIGKGKKTHTKKGKESAGFSRYIQNKKILRESGNLADRWVVEASNDSVEISSNAKSKSGFTYGAVHQWGSKKVVARQFLPINAGGGLEPKLQKQIEGYLDSKIEQAIK